MGSVRIIGVTIVTIALVGILYQYFLQQPIAGPQLSVSRLVHSLVSFPTISLPTLKTPAEPVIPLNLFQTWHSSELPPKMAECVASMKQDNPEFQHYLYDEHQCIDFLRQHFDADVLLAYQSLIPLAYKADLWRYCILYTYGGIYVDVKYKCMNDFKFITLTDDEYFVLDRYHIVDKLAVYNALIVVKPYNEIMKKCIRTIVDHVQTRYKGTDDLDVTGPTMMIQHFTPNQKKKLKRLFFTDENTIVFEGINILKMYPDYRKEQEKSTTVKNYHELWRTNQIYAK